jgi:hypothetical protein
MSDYIDNQPSGNQQPADANQQNQQQNPQNPQDTQTDNPGVIRKSTTQNILNAVRSAAGIEATSVEDLISTVAALKAQAAQAQASGQQPPQETAQEKSKRITGNDVLEQMAALRKEMEQKEVKIRERDLETSIRNSLGDRFDGDLMEYTTTKIKEQLAWENDTWVVVNGKNQQRYTMDGTPMTVKDLVDELARTQPKLLRQQPPQQGSGLRPQSGFQQGGFPGDEEFVPDYQKDPAAFKAWAQKRGLGRNSGLKMVGATISTSSKQQKLF